MPSASFSRQVTGREQVDVGGSFVDPESESLASPAEAKSHPIREMMGVGVGPDLGDKEGELPAWRRLA